MKYRVENIKSGAVLGLYEADSPEGAIRAMYIDAGYLDGEPPEYDDGGAGWDDEIRAYEVITVQMVDAVRAVQEYSHSPALFYLVPDVVYERIDWDQDLEARTREIETMDI